MPEHSPKVHISPSAAAWFADPAGPHAIGDHFANSFGKSIAPIVEQMTAGIAAACASTFPAVEPLPDEFFLAVCRPPIVVALDRVEDAIDRNTSVMVSTITTSVAPIASDVAKIARPRFYRMRLGLQIVGAFVVLIGAAEGVDQIVRVVQSIIH